MLRHERLRLLDELLHVCPLDPGVAALSVTDHDLTLGTLHEEPGVDEAVLGLHIPGGELRIDLPRGLEEAFEDFGPGEAFADPDQIGADRRPVGRRLRGGVMAAPAADRRRFPELSPPVGIPLEGEEIGRPDARPEPLAPLFLRDEAFKEIADLRIAVGSSPSHHPGVDLSRKRASVDRPENAESRRRRSDDRQPIGSRLPFNASLARQRGDPVADQL